MFKLKRFENFKVIDFNEINRADFQMYALKGNSRVVSVIPILDAKNDKVVCWSITVEYSLND